jgi:hypothetical protein
LSAPGGGVRNRAISEFRDEILERTAAMLVVFELIETRACRRKQDNVAGPGVFGGQVHSAVERPRVCGGNRTI